MQLEQLAIFYPEIACLIAEGCRALPLVISVDLVWNDTTGLIIGSEATGSFPNVLSEPFLIEGITYVVERPNADNGSILKGQDDVYVGRDPYVDASIELISSKVLPRYTIQVGATALPNLTSRFEDCWPQGWLLEPFQNPMVTGRLTRNLEDDENPYRVRLGFRGLQIDCLADLFRTCCAAPRENLRARCLAGIKTIRG